MTQKTGQDLLQGMLSCKMSTSQFDPYKVFKVYYLFSVFVQNKILNSILSTPLPALTIFRSWSLSETFPSDYPKFVQKIYPKTQYHIHEDQNKA